MLAPGSLLLKLQGLRLAKSNSPKEKADRLGNQKQQMSVPCSLILSGACTTAFFFLPVEANLQISAVGYPSL